MHVLQECQAAHDEVERLRSLADSGPKRQRTEPVAPPETSNSWDKWSEGEWKRQEKMEQNARAKVVSEDKADELRPVLRGGKLGALEHWRHGLIGAVQSWADGSRENAAKLIGDLVKHFEVQDQIIDR